MKADMMKNIAVALMATHALAASRDNLTDEDESEEQSFWRDLSMNFGEPDLVERNDGHSLLH